MPASASADTDAADEREPETVLHDTTDVPVDIRSLVVRGEHPDDNPVIDRSKMLGEIMAQMGNPYARRGKDTLGTDCSGFTARVFKNALGVELPGSSRQQFSVGTKIDKRNLLFGDLVFFHIKGRRPSHVGIYVGDGLFAHSSVSLGVTVSLLSSKYYAKRYMGARRVVE